MLVTAESQAMVPSDVIGCSGIENIATHIFSIVIFFLGLE